MTRMRIRPILMVVLMNILGFLLLYLFRQGKDVKILYAMAAMCVLNIAVYAVMYAFELGDVYLYLMVSMLVSVGMIMLFRLDPGYGYSQIKWFAAGTAVFFASYFVYRFFSGWDRLCVFYVGASVFLYVLTLAIGYEVNGSKNWIAVGKMSVQPSEFIKILYCFAIASFFSRRHESRGFKEKLAGVTRSDLILAAFVYICIGFFVLQREWGTAVLFFLVYFSMMILYDTPLILLLANFLIAAIGAYGGYLFTSHIKVRISTWLNPWADATNRGYQIIQSLMAICSGGYFGAGIGNGNPYLIPEVHSDFIFSAICEEMGIFMGIAIIILYFIFSYRGFKTALKTDDSFDKALSLALVTSFAFQTFIIVGGVIKLIPLTGITLPFVSYGGSSMVSSFIMLGILTAVSCGSRRRTRTENRQNFNKSLPE